MIIVIGLGNPGASYAKTYHNIGFLFIEYLAQIYDIKISKTGYKSIYGEGRMNDQKLMLVKPQTFMNNSGECVLMLKGKFKDAKIVVVCDDIDLEKNIVRYKKQGSGGTHNGLRSIVQMVGKDFERIKIGIGKPDHNLADYVLSKMDNQFIDESLNLAKLKFDEII